MMEPDWEKVKTVFGEAISLEAESRSVYLSDACVGQPELRAEIERLLRENDAAEGPLSEPSIWKQSEVFSPGDVIQDRFDVLRLLGRGGIGEVYEIYDRLLNRRLAMKTLQRTLTRNPDALERFKREILMGQRVSHPNACRVHDAIVTKVGPEGILSFTMELLEGQTLARCLVERGPLGETETWSLAMQMAAGLSAIHDTGLVHRDFKPGNIVLAHKKEEMRVVITDFGLTRPGPNAQAEEIWRSRTGQSHGTESYMAPEHRAGLEVTPAADVYSMGVVLLEMLQMTRPGDTAKVKRQPLSGCWFELIKRCLAQEPAQRPQDATQLHEELSAFLKAPSRRPAT